MPTLAELTASLTLAERRLFRVIAGAPTHARVRVVAGDPETACRLPTMFGQPGYSLGLRKWKRSTLRVEVGARWLEIFRRVGQKGILTGMEEFTQTGTPMTIVLDWIEENESKLSEVRRKQIDSGRKYFFGLRSIAERK